MKKIIVSVGAGLPQFAFIQLIKSKGYLVASFGKGRNAKKAIELSDYFSEMDTSDYNGAIEWLESLDGKIVAAGSFAGGVAIDTLQRIDRHFNLPTQIPEMLSVGMDKYDQQKLYKKLKLNAIETFYVSEIECDNSILDLDKYYILKPTVGRGSEGVFKLTGTQVLQKIKTDKIEEGVIQKFIEGKEYRLTFIVQNKLLKFLGCIERVSYKDTFLLSRLSVNTEHTNELKEYIQNLIEQAGLHSCIVKADVLVNGEDINLIEMDIGVGGGLYYKKYIQEGFSFDIISEYLNLILGKDINQNYVENTDCVMDYVFNDKEIIFQYNTQNIEAFLDSHLDKFITIKNKLNPEEKGKFGSNADFIFTVIHNQKNKIDIDFLSSEFNKINFKK